MSNCKNTCKHHKLEIFDNKNSKDRVSYCINCQCLIVQYTNEIYLKSCSNLTKKHNLDSISPLLLYKQMKKSEKKNILNFDNNYNEDRKDLLVFVSKLVTKNNLSEETFHLTVLLLDILASKFKKTDFDLDLISIGCFYLAAKYIENDAYLGSFSKLVCELKSILYSPEDIQHTEIICLKMLDYDLCRYTSKQYFDIMTKIGFIFDDEVNLLLEYNIKGLYFLGSKILKEFIVLFDSTEFPSYIIAFSILVLIREYYINLDNKLHDDRITILENVYNIKKNFYLKCCKKIVKFKKLEKRKETPLNTIINKDISYDFKNFNINTTEKTINDNENSNTINYNYRDENNYTKRKQILKSGNFSNFKNQKLSSNKSILNSQIVNLKNSNSTQDTIILKDRENSKDYLQGIKLNSQDVNIRNEIKKCLKLNQDFKSSTSKKLLNINNRISFCDSVEKIQNYKRNLNIPISNFFEYENCDINTNSSFKIHEINQINSNSRNLKNEIYSKNSYKNKLLKSIESIENINSINKSILEKKKLTENHKNKIKPNILKVYYKKSEEFHFFQDEKNNYNKIPIKNSNSYIFSKNKKKSTNLNDNSDNSTNNNSFKDVKEKNSNNSLKKLSLSNFSTRTNNKTDISSNFRKSSCPYIKENNSDKKITLIKLNKFKEFLLKK